MNDSCRGFKKAKIQRYNQQEVERWLQVQPKNKRISEEYTQVLKVASKSEYLTRLLPHEKDSIIRKLTERSHAQLLPQILSSWIKRKDDD